MVILLLSADIFVLFEKNHVRGLGMTITETNMMCKEYAVILDCNSKCDN